MTGVNVRTTGTNDRDDDGLRAVPFEERLGTREVLALQEPGAGPVEDAGPEPAPEPVAELIAGDRGDRATDDEHAERREDVRRGGEQPGREEQRITREEEAEEDPDSAKITANRPSVPTLRIRRFGSMPIAAITECVVLTR